MSESAKHSLEQLLQVMQRLRDPQSGCEWDLKQSFETIAPYTLEEAYEVADAIERQDYDDLKDELGDLLLQVVFHAQMASEQELFDFNDVTEAIVAKMIRRHPHIFGDARFDTEAQIKQSWEEIKRQERLEKQRRSNDTSRRLNGCSENASQRELVNEPTVGQNPNPAENKTGSAMDGVAQNLPALKRADKLQKRAARIGFDWPTIEPIWDSLDEEIAEVRQALHEHDRAAIEEELGDLLFTVVNLTRHLNVDAEMALRKASVKFDGRVRRVEQLAEDQRLTEMTLEQLDHLWQAAKRLD